VEGIVGAACPLVPPDSGIAALLSTPLRDSDRRPAHADAPPPDVFFALPPAHVAASPNARRRGAAGRV